MKDNQLIAEFMGFAPTGEKLLKNTPYVLPINFLEQLDCEPFVRVKLLNELKFQSSWDWLMPVVDKIRKLGYVFEIGNRVTDDFKQMYFVDVRHILDKKRFSTTIFNDDDSKQLTYDGVVEFIKWYNENKSK